MRSGRTCAAIVSCVVAAAILPATPAHAATITRRPLTGAMPRHAKASRLVTTAATATATASSTPFLEYFGGHVIQHVKVYGVIWGAGTYQPEVTSPTEPNMAGLFSFATNSQYIDWLSEFDTGSEFIGHGSFAGMYTITPAAGHNGATIDDEADIQPELAAHIGVDLPVPDADTLYVLMFRQGQTITMQGADSVTDFCAYHGTETYDSTTNLRYVVLPDAASDSGCGPSPGFGNFGATASHELIESITDPDIGLATVLGPPLSWYDPDNGEISDICQADPSGFETVINGYTLVSNWSDEALSCMTFGLPRTISVGSGAMLEGDAKTRTLQIPVTLSQPSHFETTVHYAVQSISAHGAATAAKGVDFLTKSGTVTFTPSVVTGLTPVEQVISVSVLGDTTHEANETLKITLSSPSIGYAILRGVGKGTIINDDAATAPLGVGVGDTTITVAMLGNHLLSFPVTLSHPVTSKVTVNFAFSNLTAHYGVDYKGTKTGTVTIAAGSRQGTARITVIATDAPLPTRTLRVTLSGLHAPKGSKLVRSAGTGTLLHPTFS